MQDRVEGQGSTGVADTVADTVAETVAGTAADTVADTVVVAGQVRKRVEEEELQLQRS